MAYYKYHQQSNIHTKTLTEELKSLNTDFEILQGKIASIISDSDLKKFSDSTSTWYSAYSQVNQTVDGLTESVGQLRMDYNDITGEITSLDSKVAEYKATVDEFSVELNQVHQDYNSVENRYSSLKQTVDGINATVGSVKTSLERDYATTKWTESQISQESQAIKLEVKSYAVEGVATEFALGDSATSAPSSGWSTDSPKWTSGKYIWMRNVTTINGNKSYSNYACIQGAAGSNGRGITSIYEYYALNNDKNNAPADTKFSTTVPQMTESNKYLWNYEHLIYTDGGESKTDKRVIGTYGDTGRGISSIKQYYLVTNASSGVTRSTSGWKETPQSTSITHRYLWNYEEIIYTSGNPTYSTPAIIGTHGDTGPQGATGPKGDTGIGFKEIVEYYAINNSNSVAPDKSKFSTGIQSPTASNKYLWNYEKVYKTDGNPTDTEPRVIANYSSNGVNGRGISSITEYYLASASKTGVTKNTYGWSTNQPDLTSTKKYLWNYTVTDWNDGSAASETTPIVISAYGDTGPQGATGPKGDTGAQGAIGVGVHKVEDQYYLSSSNTAQVNGLWVSAPPRYKNGYYYWTRFKVTMTNDSVDYSAPVLDTELNEVAARAKIVVQSEVATGLKPGDIWIDTSDGNKMYEWTADSTWNLLREKIVDDINKRVTAAEQKITDNAIIQTVTSSTAWGTKVGYGEVILAINDDTSKYVINVDKIKLEGYTTINSYFKINTNGSMECISGKIGAWTITANSIKSYDNKIYIYTHSSGSFIRTFRDAKNNPYIYSDTSHYVTISGGSIELVGADLIGNSSDIIFDTDKSSSIGNNCYIHIYGHDQADTSKPTTYESEIRIGNNIIGYNAIKIGPSARTTGDALIIDYPSGSSRLAGNLGTVYQKSGSSKRFKNYISDVAEKESNNLLKIPVVNFQYKDWYLQKDDPFYMKTLPGFFAEDVYESIPEAAVFDSEGNVSNWNERILIPYIVHLLQIHDVKLEKLMNAIR